MNICIYSDVSITSVVVIVFFVCSVIISFSGALFSFDSASNASSKGDADYINHINNMKL